MDKVSIFAAFAAGLLSFLSPCVLPLVPSYLVFVTGASLDDLERRGAVSSQQVMLGALGFVLGFATVFVALGATASVAGQLLREYFDLLSKLAGAVIILMGLHFLGLFKVGLLNREARYQGAARPAGSLGAYVIGLAFAFGWTPCIGPVLGAILAVAASTESVGTGAFLLGVYSLGLGVPFLLSAAAVGRFLGFFQRFKHHLGTVEKVMGGLLVLTGILFLTGAIQEMSYWLLETFPGLVELG